MRAGNLSLILLCLALAGLAPAALAQEQSPYSQAPAYNNPQQQQLPPPSSPYPGTGGQSPYGNPGQAPSTGYPPGYQPPASQQPVQQQPNPSPGYQNQPQTPPPGYPPTANGQGGLVDALGRFRLNPVPGMQPTGATYGFMLPALSMQVNIMSLALDQAFQMQRQSFAGTVAQMGGRITEQRQVNLGGRPAELVVALVNNPQMGQQMMTYNLFIPGANLWVQVMGSAQSGDQIQQVTNQILQNMTLR